MDRFVEMLLRFLGIQSDPTKNLEEASQALTEVDSVNFFSPEFLVSFGTAFGIALLISLFSMAIVMFGSLRKTGNSIRGVLSVAYYGETLFVGTVLLFIAQWVDDTLALVRRGILALFPDNVQDQFVLTFAGPAGELRFELLSSLATGLLKLQADIFNNMALLLAMAFIVVYPLYHVERGPVDTIVRWLIVVMGSTVLSMLWLLGGAFVINIQLAQSAVQAVDLRWFSIGVLLLAAFAPIVLNIYLKRVKIGQRIIGTIRVSNTVNTRGGPAVMPQAVQPRKSKGPSKRMSDARTREANSKYMAEALRKPENILALWGPGRPVAGAIRAGRGLKRK